MPVAVSIIVPVLNEAAIIGGFLEHLRASVGAVEIIVVDGGSKDGTCELCQGRADRVVQSTRGRARQMNAGAQVAGGEILWFVHADSRISAGSIEMIETTLSNRSIVGGCFRLEIVPPRWVYRVRDLIGNLCVDLFRVGLGDRGLFCRKEHFFEIGGYPDQKLLEDAEFYCKLRALGRVQLLSLKIQTNARRYEALGPIRTSFFYACIMTLYCAHVPIPVLEKMVARFSHRHGAGITRRLAAKVAHCP